MWFWRNWMSRCSLSWSSKHDEYLLLLSFIGETLWPEVYPHGRFLYCRISARGSRLESFCWFLDFKTNRTCVLRFTFSSMGGYWRLAHAPEIEKKVYLCIESTWKKISEIHTTYWQCLVVELLNIKVGSDQIMGGFVDHIVKLGCW